jgi:hypothetical protein
VAFAVGCLWVGLNWIVLSGDEDQNRAVLLVGGIAFLVVAIGAAYCAAWVFRRLQNS